MTTVKPRLLICIGGSSQKSGVSSQNGRFKLLTPDYLLPVHHSIAIANPICTHYLVAACCDGSYIRIEELMKDVFNQKMSQGTLVNMINECASKLKPSVDRIKETLKNESIVHFDETGIRIEAVLHWLHSAGNENYTYYFPHKKRGKKAMDAMGILPNFSGIAVHDHWDSYYQFIKCVHSVGSGPLPNM